MSGIRQLVLLVSLVIAVLAQSHASSMKREIATGAAADSAANQNTVALTQYGSFGAAAVAILTALGGQIPGLGGLLSRLGGPQTIGRVIDNGQRIIESKGTDGAALLDVARLVFEKGNPQALQTLGRLHQELSGKTPAPTPVGEPPSFDECVAQLKLRVELDAAARISGGHQPPIIPFPKAA